MKFFIDCEFDGFGGKLLSMALVPEKRSEQNLYLLATDARDVNDDWVRANVVPLYRAKQPKNTSYFILDRSEFGRAVQAYLHGEIMPHIVADWPDDLKYFCESLITGPGKMVSIPSFSAQLVRVDAYPTTVVGAIQHHALWDAIALREALTNG